MTLPFQRPARRDSLRCASRFAPIVRRSTGFTLVELLVSMAVSLVLILAVSQVFVLVGDNVSNGRAVLEMSGQLNQVSSRLQRDLELLTVPARPWPDSSSGLGFFEYLDGQQRDAVPGDPDTAQGDTDDLLAFTARASGQRFVGQVMGQIFPLPDGRFRVVVDQNDPLYNPNGPSFTPIESQFAEIVWWPELDDRNGNGVRDPGEYFILFRRVFLIRPDLVFDNDAIIASLNDAQFRSANDVSVRPGPSGFPVTNTLADLTRRENRFGHIPNALAFPNVIDTAFLTRKIDWSLTDGNGNTYLCDQAGTDVVASQVLGFDIKAFDPLAPVDVDQRTPLVPGDPGYVLPNPVTARGAYVDLNYRGTQANGWQGNPQISHFSGPPHRLSQLAGTLATYDTWSLDYERDGLDHDQDGLIDEASNGFDDDNANGADDPRERETQPPYSVPLRGLQVRIRLVDADSRQVRQLTVIQDFVPE